MVGAPRVRWTARAAPAWLLLAAATAAGTAAAAIMAPPDLLAGAERPYVGYGTAAVRMGSATYPRTAIGADEKTVSLPSAPRRPVSQASPIDEFLYTLVPPQRIVGVSEVAYKRAISNVFAMAERHRPIVANDVERVLRARPDLVFTPDSARADMPGLLRAAGVPVYRMTTMFESLASIEAHIRLVGYLTGEDACAQAEVARFEAAVARAAARRPPGVTPRVMGFGGRYSYGSRTLFNDILHVLGAENVAATHGFVGYDHVTSEHIVRWDPEWIVAGADRGQIDQTRRRLLGDVAIAGTTAAHRGQIVVLEHDVFLALSPFTTALVEALSEAFYGSAHS